MLFELGVTLVDSLTVHFSATLSPYPAALPQAFPPFTAEPGHRRRPEYLTAEKRHRHRRRPVSSDRARLTCTRRAVSGRRPCPHEKQRPHGLEPRQRRIGLSVPAVDGAPAAT
jgi:hypothetical protein